MVVVAAPASAQHMSHLTKQLTPDGVRGSDIGSFPDEATALAAWRAAGLPADTVARATIAGKPVAITPDGAIVAATVQRATPARSGPRVKTPLAPDMAEDAPPPPATVPAVPR